jgi:hypothetical protein
MTPVWPKACFTRAVVIVRRPFIVAFAGERMPALATVPILKVVVLVLGTELGVREGNDVQICILCFESIIIGALAFACRPQAW